MKTVQKILITLTHHSDTADIDVSTEFKPMLFATESKKYKKRSVIEKYLQKKAWDIGSKVNYLMSLTEKNHE